MQSVTKSVVSTVIDIAVGRGDFPDLDTPVLKYFESGSVDNVDDDRLRME
jgi:CubicO group peptidase (beta-lactamase class C family)